MFSLISGEKIQNLAFVYDLDQLGWTEAEKAFDLPAGDWRRVPKGLGYRYTLVNGEVTFVDGEKNCLKESLC